MGRKKERTEAACKSGAGESRCGYGSCGTGAALLGWRAGDRGDVQAAGGWDKLLLPWEVQ